MTNGPVSSSAHARRVQILVWSGAASITVVQTFVALPAYLRVEGFSELVPGLATWQALYAGHLLVSVLCLLLLIPVLRGSHPLLSVLIVLLGNIPAWTQVAAYVAATVIGMRRGARAIPAVLAAMVAGLFMSPMLTPEVISPWQLARSILVILPICIVCVMLGVNLQAREELLRSASREASLIRTMQEARISQSRAEERARISREMHDSLAHRLSLVSLHAGALQTRVGLDAEASRQIADSIRTLAADAGRELRQILAVLHDDGAADGARATWSDVEDVLTREREAGQEIDLHLTPCWAEAFDAADAGSRHAVLRAVEELLTNARRHGAGGVVRLDCEVEVSDCADAGAGAANGANDDAADGMADETARAPGRAVLVVRCVNGCPTAPRPTAPGGGLGLEGLRERLRLLGGELHVLGPTTTEPAAPAQPAQSTGRTAQPGRFVVMAAVPARRHTD